MKSNLQVSGNPVEAEEKKDPEQHASRRSFLDQLYSESGDDGNAQPNDTNDDNHSNKSKTALANPLELPKIVGQKPSNLRANQNQTNWHSRESLYERTSLVSSQSRASGKKETLYNERAQISFDVRNNIARSIDGNKLDRTIDKADRAPVADSNGDSV